MKDLRSDLVFPGSVIGILDIGYFRFISQHHQIGIGKNIIQSIPDHPVIYIFFLKQNHSVPVKITDIICQLPLSWKPFVRVNRCRELIIRIRIIKRIIAYPAVTEDPLKPLPGKGSGASPFRIPHQTVKIPSGMILLAPGPIFQTVFIFNGNDDPPVLFHMPLHDL